MVAAYEGAAYSTMTVLPNSCQAEMGSWGGGVVNSSFPEEDFELSIR